MSIKKNKGKPNPALLKIAINKLKAKNLIVIMLEICM